MDLTMVDLGALADPLHSTLERYGDPDAPEV